MCTCLLPKVGMIVGLRSSPTLVPQSILKPFLPDNFRKSKKKKHYLAFMKNKLVSTLTIFEDTGAVIHHVTDLIYMDLSILVMIGFFNYPVFMFAHVNTIS